MSKYLFQPIYFNVLFVVVGILRGIIFENLFTMIFLCCALNFFIFKKITTISRSKNENYAPDPRSQLVTTRARANPNLALVCSLSHGHSFSSIGYRALDKRCCATSQKNSKETIMDFSTAKLEDKQRIFNKILSVLRTTTIFVGKDKVAYNLQAIIYLAILHYNIGEAAGRNDNQNSVSDVYITSITARWKAASNDKSALPLEGKQFGPARCNGRN